MLTNSMGRPSFLFYMVPTDVAWKEGFIQGLNFGIAQGIRIAPGHEIFTYVQAVGRTLIVESTRNEIWRESTRKRGAEAMIPPFIGPGRGRGPSD